MQKRRVEIVKWDAAQRAYQAFGAAGGAALQAPQINPTSARARARAHTLGNAPTGPHAITKSHAHTAARRESVRTWSSKKIRGLEKVNAEPLQCHRAKSALL